MVVSGGESEGFEVDVLDYDAGLWIVFSIDEVAGILSVEGTAVLPEVIAVGVEDGIEDGRRDLYPSPRTAHDDEVGINAAVENVGPTGIGTYLPLTKFVGEV